jgi:CHAT domain
MEEADLRRLAEGFRAILRDRIRDPDEATRVDAELAAALALPEGQAKAALRTVLFRHPATRAFVHEQGGAGGTGWRLPPSPPAWRGTGEAPPEPEPEELRGDTGVANGGRPVPAPAPPATAPPAGRHLAVDLPERAPTGSRITLLVRITLARPDRGASAELRPMDVPPEGREVTITVSAPGLVPQGDLEQDVRVPQAADSDPVRFSFRADRVGLHTVTVRAFAGGTFVGEHALQISVEVGAALEEGPTQIAAMGALASEPGEVTLQVSRTDDDRYSFQLIGEALFPVELSRRLAGNPSDAVDAIAAELRAMAARTSPFTTPAMIRNRLQNLGIQLWADAVPEAIRRQFWDQAGNIRSFTIASDMDTIPWELLYPVDRANDNGFLVEQFPVVRRVYGQGRTRRLPLASAAYVVPPNSPGNARDEVELVRAVLGDGIADQGVLGRLDQMVALLEQAPSVLHFACHNQFNQATGSVINLDGGPFRPSDLARAVQQRSLAAASPLVFFNACRTAGEIAGFVQLMGWAKQFMAAGAGAFLGSLWAVRSSSARTFADAFYQAFVARGQPLGVASLQARQAIVADDGDPTWLAYTVYGNPAATIGTEGP